MAESAKKAGEEEMLDGNLSDMADELAAIDEAIADQEVEPIEELQDIDKPLYEIPDTDEGFRKILKERFGHDDFREG